MPHREEGHEPESVTPSPLKGEGRGTGDPGSPEGAHPASRGSLREVAALLFKLGTVAFGGPAARIATIQIEQLPRRLTTLPRPRRRLGGGPRFAAHEGWATGPRRV